MLERWGLSAAVVTALVIATGAASAAAGPNPADPPVPLPSCCPPAAPGAVAPPPAWVVAPNTAGWLAYGSYCWGDTAAVCASESIPRDDLPRVVLRRGTIARFFVEFEPSQVTLTIGGRATTLKATEVDADVYAAAWPVGARGGYGSLDARTAAGRDATYVVNVVVVSKHHRRHRR